MASTPTTWWLFVDESGQFQKVGDDVSIGGLLARDGSPGSRTNALREVLKPLVPETMWPLHAAYWDIPLALALAATATDARRRDARTTNLRSLADQATRALPEQHAPLADAVKALSGETKPDLTELRSLDGLLHGRQPHLHSQLASVTAEIGATVSRVLRAACADGEGYAVAAGETERADAALSGERYLVLLACVMARAARILEALPGEHLIQLMPSQRNVRNAVLGKDTPLHQRDVAPLIATLQPRLTRVSIRFNSAPRWGPQMHTALSLADFIANRARRTLPRREHLAVVEGALSAMIGPGVRIPIGSQLSASGAACDPTLVAKGVAGGRMRPWAMEQAMEWAALGKVP